MERSSNVLHSIKGHGVLTFRHHNARIVAFGALWVEALAKMLGVCKYDLASNEETDEQAGQAMEHCRGLLTMKAHPGSLIYCA